MKTEAAKGLPSTVEASVNASDRSSEDCTEKASLATAQKQIVSAGGVYKGEWKVAVVKRNTEKVCRDKLQQLGHESFVATQQETRTYACRKHRNIERVIISNLVFVRTTEKDRISLLKTCPFIHYFLTDKASQVNDFGRHPIAIIPDEQIDTLRFMLYHADTPVNFSPTPLRLGDRIRVVRGNLMGLEGNVVRHENTTHIAVQIDFLGCAMVAIPSTDIERAC